MLTNSSVALLMASSRLYPFLVDMSTMKPGIMGLVGGIDGASCAGDKYWCVRGLKPRILSPAVLRWPSRPAVKSMIKGRVGEAEATKRSFYPRHRTKSAHQTARSTRPGFHPSRLSR